MEHENIKIDFLKMLGILLILAVPFFMILFYTRLSIQTALLRREIRITAFKRDELIRKNNAIKNELSERVEKGSIESLYFKKSGSLPFYLRNKVVTVELNSEND